MVLGLEIRKRIQSSVLTYAGEVTLVYIWITDCAFKVLLCELIKP